MKTLAYILFIFSAFTAYIPSFSVNDKLTEAPEQRRPNMLLGEFEPNELEQAPYTQWYTPNYKRARLDENRIAHLKTLLQKKEIEILGFVGSWCGDTKRELPILMKILDQIDFDTDKLTLTGVNYQYQAPDGSNKIWEVRRVPTFIILENGKEIGRFVERSQVNLLEDFIKILEH